MKYIQNTCRKSEWERLFERARCRWNDVDNTYLKQIQKGLIQIQIRLVQALMGLLSIKGSCVLCAVEPLLAPEHSQLIG
jgi:hypothetical protein